MKEYEIICTYLNGCAGAAYPLTSFEEAELTDTDAICTTLVGGTTACQQVMNLAEMKDSAAGNCFHATGKLATPMGASLIHVPTMDKKQLVAVDKNCCLEMVQAGGILTDYDKLIDRQMDRASISVVAGFAQLFPNAARVVNCN